MCLHAKRQSESHQLSWALSTAEGIKISSELILCMRLSISALLHWWVLSLACKYRFELPENDTCSCWSKVSKSHQAVKRAQHNTEEGNLSLEEDQRGWYSTPSSLMHPFSCVHSSVTRMGCFSDTATSPANRDILTQHWHSAKRAFLFSYCKRENWLHQTEIRACFPTSFSPVLH